MIRLIATDMDGTLLNSKNEIDKSFYEVLPKLREKDIKFTIASGRQYDTLLQIFQDISDNLIFIAENGTYVKYKDEEIMVNPLDKPLVHKLIQRAREVEDGYIVLCGKNASYVENTNPKFIKEVEKYFKHYEIVDNVEEVDDLILKVTVCDFKGAETNSSHLFEEYKTCAQVTVSGFLWLDVVAQGVNKGMALEGIQKVFNITPAETMVFGDYLNDLEMMKVAEHSYAMANAHEDLKKAARYIAKSNDENGVVEELKKLI